MRGFRAVGMQAGEACSTACSTTRTTSSFTAPIHSAVSTTGRALRAAEEMARVVEDQDAGATYRDLYDKGRRWIDANLFNGEYYTQQVRSMSRDQIAKSTVGNMGADHPETPEFQLGDGCLADQLIGQYLADIAGLGPLLDPDHIQKTLR